MTTRTDDIVDTLHGKLIRDPYRWLEDEKAPEVQAWMDAQDAHARAALRELPARAGIAARLRELFYFDAVGAPAKRGERYFLTRKHVDREKMVVYWRQGEDGAERVLFDPNTWSADGTVGLGGWWPSYDGVHVAYSVKENNSDETVTRVKVVATGEDLPDRIEGTKYSGASWTPGDDQVGRGFYYTWVPPVGAVPVAERPGYAEVRFHALGGAADEVIHGATGDPQTFLGGGISRDGAWLTVAIQHGWNSTDLKFKRVGEASWTTLVEGVEANFDISIWRDRFYVTTDHGAPRCRVFAVEPARPAREHWREIVPESDATLESASIVGEHLILTYLRDVASEVIVCDLDGGPLRKLALPPLGSCGGISGNPDEDTGYFAFTSFTQPQVIYRTSIATGAGSEWTRIELPVDTSKLAATQVRYPSKDGTSISMFIIHRTDVVRDGARPVLLYGYGGFNVTMTPAFAGSRATWLEHGGVYAIPNLRGGGEYGEDWHKGGMRATKQNTFDDFIAAGEYLIAESWTSPAHLGIMGGSNGGLLVGAVMTQRPELFGAVVCAVPLLDMLRYHLYGSGKTWIPEYGDPELAEEFAWLHAYSPYRVAIDAGPRAYPALLVDTSDHDDRVDPMHARKLFAAIHALQTADRPVLLRIERNAGHGGADLVKQQVESTADELAFLLSRLA